MFTLYHRYAFEVQKNMISQSGIDLIQSFIMSQRLQEGEWKELNPENRNFFMRPLPDEWDWQWLVTEGDYVGKFPKRVRKYYHVAMGLKCPETFLVQIGNLARQHTEDRLVYSFEFVNRFDWDDGDFGDSGSCYWGSNSGAIEILYEQGAMAILFYNADGDGYARAWFVDLTDSEGIYVVFNGYGFASSPTRTIARIVAAFFGLAYKKIWLSNFGMDNGLLWINGGIGYVIGESERIQGVDRFDFEWPGGIVCYNCGTYIVADNSYTGADGYDYCEYCFYDSFDTCSWCGETHYRDAVYWIDDELFCDDCRNRRCHRCAKCQEWHITREMTEIKGRYYCDKCHE